MAKVATHPADVSTQAGRLRWAREAAGFSSSRAAAEANDWNENTYKSHELGIRGKEGIKPRHLQKYARAFKVDLTWLTYGTGPQQPKPEDAAALARQLLKAIEGQ